MRNIGVTDLFSCTHQTGSNFGLAKPRSLGTGTFSVLFDMKQFTAFMSYYLSGCVIYGMSEDSVTRDWPSSGSCYTISEYPIVQLM